MAFLTMSLYSDVLQMDTNVNVLLPEVRKGAQPFEPDRKYPVLYLLHGHGDDHTAWIRKSNIELVVRDLPLVVVMPQAYRGFYINNFHGLNLYDYITEELPKKIANFFPISTERENTFIAGNSMGGYGAFRAALSKPEQYAGAAALSGALIPFCEDNVLFEIGGQEFTDNLYNVFGAEEKILSSDNNILNLVDKLNNYKGKQPILFQCCGTDDSLTYTQNIMVQDYINEHTNNLDYVYSERPGGHDWGYWNPMIVEFIRRFELIK